MAKKNHSKKSSSKNLEKKTKNQNEIFFKISKVLLPVVLILYGDVVCIFYSFRSSYS